MKYLRLLVFGGVVALSTTAQPDPWTTLRVLEGKWEGPATGDPGKGISYREYRFDLGGRFLTARNKSVYEPKSPGAKPETHEDFSMFSHDRALKSIVLRQFHSEGFVNEYTLDSTSDGGMRFEFTTTRIENIPAGWRAKESYHVVSPDEIVETFSLAGPGRDFTIYSETRLKRVK